MDSETREASTQQTFDDTVQSLSKTVALFIAIVYVCGFLVTSLHDFRYGFSEMNPFKPRILTAGAWFLLFLALPFALVRQLLRHKIWKSEAEWWYKAANLIYAYYLSCILIFFTAGNIFLFDGQNQQQYNIPATWKIVLGAIVVLFGLVTLGAFYRRIPRSIKAIAASLFFTVILWQACDQLFLRNQFQQSALPLWMFGIGVISLYEMRIRSWRLQLGDWPQTIILFLAALLIFATMYYPHIRSSWGGGSPISVTLILTKDSPAFANQQVSCLLIDETDSGFYVIGKEDKHATFIPRGSVRLIHFADESETSLFGRMAHP